MDPIYQMTLGNPSNFFTMKVQVSSLDETYLDAVFEEYVEVNEVSDGNIQYYENGNPDVVRQLYDPEFVYSPPEQIDGLVQPDLWMPPHDISNTPIRMLLSEGVRNTLSLDAHANSKTQL